MANTWPEYTANNQTISKQLKNQARKHGKLIKKSTTADKIVKCDGKLSKSAKRMPEPAAAGQG